MTDGGKVVLVIEDEAVLRESVANYLEDRGYRVLMAENGRVGLELFRQEKPDLILTDLRMPEMGGMEVLSKIGEDSPETPLIVVSGTGRISDSIEALHLGAWDYILKPVEDMSVISHAVGNALERARLARENQAYQEKLEEKVRERTSDLERANERLVYINNRLKRVVSTTRDLTFCSDARALGPLLLKEFASHMEASGGSLFLLEEDGLWLASTLEDDHVPEHVPFPLPVGSVLERTIESQQPFLIQDIEKEGGVRASGWSGYRDGSVLAFPLMDETEKVIGVLTLHSKAQPPFLEEDLEIGSILASYGCETLRATRAVETLQSSEERFRDLAEMLPEGVFEADLNLNLVYGNHCALEMFGYTEEEMSGGINGMDLIALADRERVRATLGTRMEGKDPGAIEYEAVRKDGSTFPMLFHANSVRVDGELTGIRGVIVDLTDRHHAEQVREELETQLRQSQKMDAVGQLAGGVAHDFNNILTAINGYAEMLIDGLEPADPLRADIEEIRHAGERASELTNQLLTFSRKQVISPKVICPNEILERSQKMLRRIIGEDIDLVSHPAADLGRVKADPAQLDQVLVNLAVNARDAMREGGKLTIETRNVIIDQNFCDSHVGAVPGDFVLISVSDAGHGMNEDVRLRVFEPFFSTKERGQGTGLGLATVYGIVKQNDGFVSVESEVGVGTVFNVYFPLVQDEVDQLVKVKSSELPTGSETILLVEDEDMVRSLAKRILERRGYSVLEANDGGDAYLRSKYFDGEIDLLLTDVIMPNMNGRQLHEELVHIRPSLKVLYMSGYPEDIVANHGILDQETDLVQKPFTIEVLTRRVREALDR